MITRQEAIERGIIDQDGLYPLQEYTHTIYLKIGGVLHKDDYSLYYSQSTIVMPEDASAIVSPPSTIHGSIGWVDCGFIGTLCMAVPAGAPEPEFMVMVVFPVEGSTFSYKGSYQFKTMEQLLAAEGVMA